MLVIPKLAVLPGWIITQVDVFEKLIHRVLGLPAGTVNQASITEIGEFLPVTRPQKRVIDNQLTAPYCRFGFGPWPFSSSR